MLSCSVRRLARRQIIAISFSFRAPGVLAEHLAASLIGLTNLAPAGWAEADTRLIMPLVNNHFSCHPIGRYPDRKRSPLRSLGRAPCPFLVPTLWTDAEVITINIPGLCLKPPVWTFSRHQTNYILAFRSGKGFWAKTHAGPYRCHACMCHPPANVSYCLSCLSSPRHAPAALGIV